MVCKFLNWGFKFLISIVTLYRILVTKSHGPLSASEAGRMLRCRALAMGRDGRDNQLK